MRRSVIVCVSVFAAFFLFMSVTSAVFAESRPFQASLTPDVALEDRDVMIEGLTLSVWGENPQRALSLGFVNGSTGDSSGFSWGLLMNYADSYKGVHWAFVNYAKHDFLGWQGGFVNYTDREFTGLQTGWINYAGHMKGVQFGLVNYAETAGSGFQLGLANVIRENRWFKDFPDSLAPCMVFVNWRF